jgi:hypothetical protein
MFQYQSLGVLGANKMSALVAHEMSGFDWFLKEGADETDRDPTGGAENGFRGGIRGLAGETLDTG